MYKLDLPAKMKIYSVQHIIILKPAHGDIEFLLYKMEMYKGQKKRQMGYLKNCKS